MSSISAVVGKWEGLWAWRHRPELNRCTRFCRPLRNHSATVPYRYFSILWRVALGVILVGEMLAAASTVILVGDRAGEDGGDGVGVNGEDSV